MLSHAASLASTRHVRRLPAHEVKYLALDLKGVDTDGSFEGYASLFHREDLSRDIVMPGAFEQSLRERGAPGVKMLFQHDANQPIGVWSTLNEDARGLWAQGRLMPEVAKAREVHARMRAGALHGLSIGFRAVKGRRDRASGVRRLEKIDLWEISVVTFPLLPEARVAAMKARPFAGAPPTERDFERWLTRDAGLSRKEARALMSAGFSGLKALRDAGPRQDEETALAAPATGRCRTSGASGAAGSPVSTPRSHARSPSRRRRRARLFPRLLLHNRKDLPPCPMQRQPIPNGGVSR